MRIFKLLFTIFILFCMSEFQAQGISNEYKQEVINSLSITDADSFYTPHYGGHAIDAVIEYEIVEAIPAIIEYIWKQEPYDQTKFLEALLLLDADEVEELALAFIDSVDTYTLENPYITKLELKLLVVEDLFSIGNYSKYQVVIDRIEEAKPELEYGAIFLLPEIIWNFPQHEEFIKNELIKFVNDSDKDIFKLYATINIDTVYGTEMLDLYFNVFEATKSSVKMGIVKRVLSKYRNNSIFEFLKDKLVIDTNRYVRADIGEQLLKNYGTPEVYKYVKDFQLTDSDNTFLSISLTRFKPIFLDGTTQTTTLIDTLTSYTIQSYGYEWLKDEAYKTELLTKLTNAKTKLNSGDSLGCRTVVATFQNSVNQVYQDSAGSYPKYVSDAGYKFMYHYAQYILDRLPEAPTVEGLPVKLQDSQGNLLQNGTLQYYDSGWQDAIDNGNGTFTVQTERTTVSLKMLYAGASQQINNVTVGPDTAVFKTVNAMVKLLNSQNTLIDSGLVKYYASGWKDLGTTVNGVATKELLPRQYTFRMEYGGANQDLAQGIDTNATVVFQTVKATVQLLNSQNTLIDSGMVKYYASGWKDLGTTLNGVATKELLPRQYTFRMEYGGANQDLAQGIDTNATVVFQTVNAEVQLKDSQGNLLDGGVVKYYASGWKDFGAATNGIISKELLPRQYTFRMEYGRANQDLAQGIDTNATLVFQTTNAEVQLKDSQSNFLDGGVVKYYASGWKDFGTATNGTTSKELLPRQYTFRMEYGGANQDFAQSIDTNATVVFQTTNAEVQLKDSQANFIDEGKVQYYASGWKDFGTTQSGITSKELLGRTYSFRMTHEKVSNDKSQDVSINNGVIFSTVLATIQVKDSQNQLIENAEVLYYSAGWNQIGFTVNGEITKELLPKNITFRAKQGTTSQDKQQDTSINNIVEIILE